MDGPATPEPAGASPRRASRVNLLVVCGLALVALVAAGIKWSEARRNDAECRGNLEMLGRAARSYAEENGGRLPYGRLEFDGVVFKYLRHERFLSCPVTLQRYVLTRHERKVGDPAHLLLAWDRAAHGFLAKRQRALFVNGRVEALPPEELERLVAAENRERPTPPRLPEKPRYGIREDPESPPPGYRPPTVFTPKPAPETQPPATAPDRR